MPDIDDLSDLPDVSLTAPSLGAPKRTLKSPRPVADLPSLVDFAKSKGFTVTSTTGGRHNTGSSHYAGRAIDIRTRDKSSDEVARLMSEAQEMGLKVRDERVRPRGQRVWSGAHLHLEVGGSSPARQVRQSPARTDNLSDLPSFDLSETADTLSDVPTLKETAASASRLLTPETLPPPVLPIPTDLPDVVEPPIAPLTRPRTVTPPAQVAAPKPVRTLRRPQATIPQEDEIVRINSVPGSEKTEPIQRLQLSDPNLPLADVVDPSLSLPARSADVMAQATRPTLSRPNVLQTITVRMPGEQQPTESEINNALLEKLGAGWKETGQRFRDEMGIEPLTSDKPVMPQLVSDGRRTFYDVSANPTKELVEAFKAYAEGGKEAYYAKLDEQKAPRTLIPSTVDKAAGLLTAVTNPSGVGRSAQKDIAADALTGLLKTNQATVQMAENLRQIHEGDDPRVSDPNQRAIDEARASMPKYRTNTGALAGETIEAVGGLARLSSIPAGGQFAPLLATYVENLNRGDAEALKAAASIAPLIVAGIGADKAAALLKMSPVERQIFVRGAQGAINVGQSAAQGAEPGELLRQGIIGAGFPIGKRPSLKRSGLQELNLEAPEMSRGRAPISTEPKTIVRHSNPEIDGDAVVGKTTDGKLIVEGEDGVRHTIKHPRKGGNQEATLVKQEAENVEATQDDVLAVNGSAGVDNRLPDTVAAVEAGRQQGQPSVLENVGGNNLRDTGSRSEKIPSPTIEPAAQETPKPKGVGFGKGLTRSYQAGMNRASLTFASLDQRDLFDLTSKGSDNVSLQEKQRRADRKEQLRNDLARRLNVSPEEVTRMSFAVRDDVRAQMKGVKDGEARTLANNALPANTVAPAESAPIRDAQTYRAALKKSLPTLSDDQVNANSAIVEAWDDLYSRHAGVEKGTLFREALAGVESGRETGEGLRQDAHSVTNMPEFKRWFGQSKVVDEKGAPLAVYHGTNRDFTAFDGGRNRSVLNRQFQGDGFHFTANPEVAAKYADANRNQTLDRATIYTAVERELPPHVQKVFKAVVENGRKAGWASLSEAEIQAIVKYRHPSGKDINDLLEIAQHVEGSKYASGGYEPSIWGGKEYLPDWLAEDLHTLNMGEAVPKEQVVPVFLKSDNLLVTSDPRAAQRARAQGYDGVKYTGEGTVDGVPEYIVFKPEQIKSATGNRGTFDPNDPNILRQDTKGATSFLKDGRAVIKYFESADVSTGIHEPVHAFLPHLMKLGDISKDDAFKGSVRGFERWMGLKEGEFGALHQKYVDDTLKGADKVRYTEAQEKAARGFERYLKEGKAPSVQLRQVFESFKEWLTGIYGAIRGKDHPLNVKLTPEAINFWDSTLGAPKGEHGRFTSELYRSADAESPSFFAHPAVREALNLKTIPAEATPKERSQAMTETSDALTRAMGQQRASQVPPERIRAWAQKNNLPADAMETLPATVTPQPAAAPRRLNDLRTSLSGAGAATRKVDTQNMSLSQAVRALGGVQVDAAGVMAGEVRRLSNRETGSSGLVNNRSGMDVERMAQRLRESGYDASPDPNEFLSQIEADLRGEKTYSTEREVDYEAEYRKAHPEASQDALISLLETEAGGTLFDKVESGQASKREVEEFRRVAEEEYGVFPEHVQAIIARGRERATAKDVSGTSGVRPEDDFDFRDDPVEDRPSFLYQRKTNSRQQGFNLDELVPERANPDKVTRMLDRYDAGEAAYQKQKAKVGDENMRRFGRVLDESVDPSVRRIARDAYKRIEAGAAVPDTLPDTLIALSKLAELRRTKTPVNDFLNQGSLFGDRELTPQQERILQALDANPRKVIDEVLPEAKEESRQNTLFQSSQTSSRRQRAYRAILEAEGQRKLLDEPLRRPTARERIADVANVPRSIKSSLDLSAAMRQGAMYSLTHPGTATKLFFGKQLRSLSDKGYENFKAELKADPDAKLMLNSGLHLTSLAPDRINNREEAFASKLAGKVPGVRRSEQAYTTFLDAARSTWFKQLARQAESAAKESKQPVTADQYKTIAKFVNRATGRGDLGKGAINDAAPLLNSIFFAPKYAVSKVQVFDPRMYAQLPAGARKTAIREAVQYYATIAATAALLKYGFGLSVGTDPEESDFLKLKIGDTRYDLAAGQAQYVTLAARLLRHAENRRTGQKEKFGGGAWSTLDRFVRYKYAPVPSAIRNTMEGKNAIGEKTSAAGEAFELIKPIYLNDLYEAYQKEGGQGVLKNAPGFVGVGVQTYGERSKTTRTLRPPSPKIPRPTLPKL